ncbi:hypothetical protein [Accumulibacter sp.]|uniref:hypothetical protein n=1 Tax=Accumulibacter sp. TaxID=2053492 RepID=UPI00261BE675|nr:hypothetical protein [Accumulibacter sp.]
MPQTNEVFSHVKIGARLKAPGREVENVNPERRDAVMAPDDARIAQDSRLEVMKAD